MVAELLSEKYADKMWGVLNCYDRVVLSGNLQPLCCAKGMTGYLYGQKIRIFDYAEFAAPLRKEIRINAEALAKENEIEIEFIKKAKSFRKEDRIEKILKTRGTESGLAHIFSAMEGYKDLASVGNCQMYLMLLLGKNNFGGISSQRSRITQSSTGRSTHTPAQIHPFTQSLALSGAFSSAVEGPTRPHPSCHSNTSTISPGAAKPPAQTPTTACCAHSAHRCKPSIVGTWSPRPLLATLPISLLYSSDQVEYLAKNSIANNPQ